MRTLPFLCILLVASTAQAVPFLLQQQGRLLDSSDQPLTGSQSVIFSLYDDDTLGNLLWTEPVDVTFTDGYFSVTLGQTNPVDEDVLDNPEIYLGLTIATEELLPRQLVVSVPYAVMSGTAENVIGGVVDVTSISVGGNEVVNGTGAWVGPPPADTLSGLSCDNGDVAQWNGSAWSCAPLPQWVETDPLFGASAASGVTGAQVGQWDAAHAWGDHSAVGYLLTESDPQVGTLVASNLCRANAGATAVDCNGTETDPEVGATTNGNWCVGNGTQVTCSATAPVDTNGATLCGDGEYLNGNGTCYPVRPTRVSGVLAPGTLVRLNNRSDRGVTLQLYFGHLNTGGAYTYVTGTGQDGNTHISCFAMTSGVAGAAAVSSFILFTGSNTFNFTAAHGRLRGGNDGTGPAFGSVVLENNDTTNINYVAYLGPSSDYPY